MSIRRSCYRLPELCCFLYIFSLPFYFDYCCFIAVSFAFLRLWPITTGFLKGLAVFQLMTFSIITFDALTNKLFTSNTSMPTITIFAQTAVRRPMVGGGVRLTAARRLISVGGGGVRNLAARRYQRGAARSYISSINEFDIRSF
jgi:hypothetical protein